MLLLDDVLNPIPGPNPSGQNLRYAPIYEKIKEARREDDDAPQGDWKRERKTADYLLVQKLATEALARQSKDLQLAAWLTEALLNRDGFAGLKQGLDILRGLLEKFWDTLYPELEDGDAELRAGPLEWVGSRLDRAVRGVPLTTSGLNWFKYRESRTEGGEADQKITAQEFDETVKATPDAYYQELIEELNGALAALAALDEVCQIKFKGAAPGFNLLLTALEEVRQTVRLLLLDIKGSALAAGKEAQEKPDSETVVEAATVEPEPAPGYTSHTAAAAAAPVMATAAEPSDYEDAVDRVLAAARFLRREEPCSPVPYLLLRGLRWGELRANGFSFEAPSTEIRQRLKRLALDGEWEALLEAAEDAMAQPCGRAWLDLQRYVVRACNELGSSYDPIVSAIRSELRALLEDFPRLPEVSLLDDTPTANTETQAWLREFLKTEQTAPYQPGPSMSRDEDEDRRAEPEGIDSYELAVQSARAGREEEALEILTREMAQQTSGRARFQRRIQLAQICLATGHHAIAQPILEDLANEIEQRRLDEWEDPEVVAHPLMLLFRCLNKLDGSSEQKQKIYSRICRLDPVKALECSK